MVIAALSASGKLVLSDGLIDDIIIKDRLMQILTESNALVDDIIIKDRLMQILTESNALVDDVSILDGEG